MKQIGSEFREVFHSYFIQNLDSFVCLLFLSLVFLYIYNFICFTKNNNNHNSFSFPLSILVFRIGKSEFEALFLRFSSLSIWLLRCITFFFWILIDSESRKTSYRTKINSLNFFNWKYFHCSLYFWYIFLRIKILNSNILVFWSNF